MPNILFKKAEKHLTLDEMRAGWAEIPTDKKRDYLDFTMQEFVACFDHGRFDIVDDFLKTLDLEPLDSSVLVGLVCTAWWAMTKLPGYQDFFSRVETALTNLGMKDRIPALLDSFRKPLVPSPSIPVLFDYNN